jgi:hypothetical protein
LQRGSTQQSGAGDSRPGLSGEQMRDMRNQAQQYANDAQALRQMMQQAGMAGRDLASVDEVIKTLRELEGERPYRDPNGLQALQGQVLDKMQKIEFDLRKRVDTTNDQLYLSGSEDVPPTFRSQVEEYSRRLSKKPAGGGTQPQPPPPAKPGRGGGE